MTCLVETSSVSWQHFLHFKTSCALPVGICKKILAQILAWNHVTGLKRSLHSHLIHWRPAEGLPTFTVLLMGVCADKEGLSLTSMGQDLFPSSTQTMCSKSSAKTRSTTENWPCDQLLFRLTLCGGCLRPWWLIWWFVCLAAERVTSLGKDWHRPCLKCEKCNKTLSAGSHAEVRTRISCDL